MPFALGQRWISDTESDLGLGAIVALDIRTITLLFPAVGENRLYSRSDAPITRVIFNVGDTITSQDGWQLTVENVEEKDGLLNYQGTRLDNGQQNAELREMMLDSKLTFSKPQDRLFAGQIDRTDRFVLRYHARKYQSQQFSMAWSGLRGIRANLIPHQLHIANEVAQRYAPRVLLADEVGLGKTIEAGMIAHQRLLSGSAERVLIVVPETLQHQWLVEMLRRFNLHFSLFDDERYAESLLDSDNPFETEQLIICSLDFVYKNKQRLELLSEADWDLLIVDEAHHLVWHENEPSSAYNAIEKLARVTPAVLLLTATPEQLGQDSHFARLRLLDPDRFHSFREFIDEQEHYKPVADAVTQLLTEQPLNDTALNALGEMLSEQDIEPLIKSINGADDNSRQARDELISLLMDRHGTSRVLFRNTRQGVKGFPQRELQQIKLALPSQYQTAMKVSTLMSSKQPLEQQAKNMLYPEQIFQALEGDNVSWLDFDPRVEWLIEYLKQHRNEKVLVICAKAETALSLEQILREREAIRSAVFHEGLSILERDRAAAYFSSEESGAQVLLCSEIGSEGRNFQFASRLIMFDLPFNPDLLEQRIGRLDRIGQSHDIQIMVPYLENTAQAVLLRWFHEGLDAFEHTCPTGRSVYDATADNLLNYLANPANGEGLDEFIKQTRQYHERLKAQLESGRDRLLELNSNGGEKAQQLANAIEKQDSSVALVTFALNLFDIVGINQEDHCDNMMIITPSDHMLVPDFPGIPVDGCTITFDRELALSREDSQFISWEHPIIRNGLDLILSGDTGCCAVSLLKNKALPVGTLLLELIYVVEAQAPKYLQLQRYLPATPIRLLIDRKGNNLAEKVTFDSFNPQLSSINRHNGSKIVAAVQADIHDMLTMSEQTIAAQAQAKIDEAKQQAETTLSAELNRLQALKVINPSIRDDEIELLEQQRVEVLEALQQASWRLDALRLIVVSHQ
jgi:ATP-dependent helicase HepA